jgi:hypothetical protein
LLFLLSLLLLPVRPGDLLLRWLQRRRLRLEMLL